VGGGGLSCKTQGACQCQTKDPGRREEKERKEEKGREVKIRRKRSKKDRSKEEEERWLELDRCKIPAYPV